MISGIAKSISIATLLLALVGCASDESLVGKYSGTHSQAAMGRDPSDPIVDRGAVVELELKPNGTFTLIDSALPMSGTWTSSGDKIDLVVTELLNQPVKKAAPELTAALFFKIAKTKTGLSYKSKNATEPTPLTREAKKSKTE